MGAWEVSTTPSAAHEQWAKEGQFLFASRQWAHVLEGLGCTTVFAWHHELECGVVVPVFRRGPLRVAFLGFPIAGECFDALNAAQFEALQHALAGDLRCDLVRGVRSQALEPGPGALPEVWIDDLQAWPGSRGKRIAKDLAFAARAGGGRQPVESFADGAVAYALYQQTVLGHGGRLRYTNEYFHRLLALAGQSSLLTAAAMQDGTSRTSAFAVTARHGRVAYYLHGAVEPSARACGDGDVLLARLIENARKGGALSFSLMASPRDQPGLVRYKSKWGDHQGFTNTHDVGRGLLGRPLAYWVRRNSRLQGTGKN
ncbi:GNAT family N-acetyltransferase [Lysobacter sp. GCM10012299]|jgi:GNAT superfamily N-acetyltransferase|uniref:GNAT family N-acetyltransferase n=1 Tax=Lysobacter sp. GCM10012299 TaxID=3317333 RepID=UPI00360994C5